MAEQQISFAGLSEYARAEVCRHLRQTYGMNYGSIERIESLFFGLPFDDPAVIRTEPPAVLLRQLAAAARSGGSVKVPRMSKPDAVRTSELLRQSAGRASREDRRAWDGADAARTLAGLCRDFDESHRLPADELERAEHMRVRAI